MKKFTILMVLLIASMTLLVAQSISEYTFSTVTNGSLENMSTGTTDLLPTGTYYYLASSGIANIGFGFNFGPSVFTQFSANSNGQMQLGGAVIAGTANPAAGLSILAPLANGVAGNNSIQPSGKVHYKVLGSAPNRRLVVEWLDMRIPYGNLTGTYSRMQAWLYETSNVIKFVYGTMYRNGTIQQNRGVFIASSNVVGSIGNITTIATTPTWDTTGTGTIVTSFSTNNYTNLTSAADGARRVFTFTPPVVSTPPNPAVLVGPDNAGWAYTDAILSWNGGGGAPTSYDVYFGTDPNPPFVANQASGYYDPALLDGTTYYWKVVPKNANGEASSTIWSFRTPTPTQLAESFESATYPPPGWMNTNPGFSRSTTTGYAKHGIAIVSRATSTITYTLSTPLLNIVTGNTLDFYARSGTALKAMQIVYSPDRTTWTQLGPDITFAAIDTWYRQTIDLSSLNGQNLYLGFRTASQTSGGNIQLDYIFGPEIQPEVPSAVTLVSPTNGYNYVVVKPTFTWTTTAGGGVPTEYKLYLDTNPDPTTLVATVPTLSYTLPYALNPLTQYYWKVVASNSAGDSPASLIRNFTTTVSTPLPATNPVPSDGATGVAINATLSWDVTANTSYYKVYFGTTLPVNQNANQTTNSWTPPTMTPGTTYYWKVVPFHQFAGDAENSPVWSFTTMSLPLAATNPNPADMATDVIINASLSWDAVFTASSYDVYFGTTLPGTPNANVLTPGWTPPTMDVSTLYYWKVVPKNAIGDAINNPTWSFTTGSAAIVVPLAATNPVPMDTATGVAIDAMLSWDASIGADSYDVYFGTTLPATPNANVLTPGWTPPTMLNNTMYSWMVIPKNVAGEAINNVTWTFTTIIALPLAASNPIPMDTATDVAIDASLLWDAVAGADSYDVYFGTILPATPNANVLTPGWTPPLMLNNTLYSWMVVPKNAAGDALNSPVWSFTTIVALPLAAVNPYPADMATGIWPDEIISWDEVIDATSYDVYFGTTLPATPNENISINVWVPPLMEYNTQYVWMVVPKNAAGEAINNPIWTFTTIVALPLAATNPIPADMAIDVAIDASLLWDAVAGAESYDVYFGAILPEMPNANVLTPGWTPPVMDNDTVYYWMVIPMNAAGEAIDNPIWSFTTIVALPLATANPFPMDLEIDVAIDASLFWDDALGATSYDVYFGTTLPATPNANVLVPSWTPPLMDNNTVYYWMIVPLNAAGAAINNPTWSFTTIVTVPAVATNPIPADMAINVAIDASLMWDAAAGAESYDVYFGATLPATPNANVLTPGWTPPVMDNNTVYYWMVVPKNVAGEAINNPTWSFTTIVALPMAAINPNPADMAINVPIDAALSWDIVVGADSYDVYFGTVLPAIPNANVLSPGWTPPVMDNNSLYVWKVVPKNAAGEAINNPTWSFTTIVTVPAVATNPIPADMAINVAIDASLMWDAAAGAESYDVYFGTTLPATPNANVLVPSWTPPLMDNNTVYYWMIVPLNAAGAAINNPTWSFTTIVTVPAVATNPIPADMAINVAIDASLMWDAAAGAESYDVYFGATLPATPNANVLTPGWTPPVMDNNTVYYWMVVPKNVAGEAINNPTWSFTTIVALPMAAINPNPADMAINVPIDAALSWDIVVGADSYDVYFGTVLPAIPNANVLSPGWTPPVMDNNSLYVWKVVPKNAAGEAINNPTWSFTTIVTVPAVATNPIPADMAINVAIDASLMWDAAAGAESYDVYFGTVLPAIPNANVLSPGWTPPVMDNNTVYYWMIIPINVAGEAQDCPIWSFTTIVALPLAAINPNPADMAINVPIDAALSWDIVVGADSYDVYFGTVLPAIPNANVLSPGWTPPVMDNNSLYVWKVVPKNAAGEAINTPIWSFTTIAAVALTTPVNLQISLSGTDVVLTWDPVIGADAYVVYSATDPYALAIDWVTEGVVVIATFTDTSPVAIPKFYKITAITFVK